MISDKTVDRLLLLGLLLIPLQFIQVSIIQSAQIWALFALGWLVYRGQLQTSLIEVLVFAMFISFALIATFLSGYPHIKAIEQLIKFGFLYPAFFLVGRALGSHYLQRKLPYGYLLLWLLLGFEYLVQHLQIPILFHQVDFMQDALYGTFKERNWLAIYFFLASYLLFLQSPRRARDVLHYMVLGVVVALLSQSKTILIPVGIVVLLHMPRRWGLKTVLIAIGTALYVWRFGHELTGQLLQVRLQDERGLAFSQTMKLLSDNLLGYGFGFVEAYFSNLWFTIKGLGLGTNSIFSSPLDLMLIAGIPGLIFWGVFFAGIGVRSIALLAPIAAWSLLNPLHQSEMVYLFLGLLVAFGMRQSVPVTARATVKFAAGEPV